VVGVQTKIHKREETRTQKNVHFLEASRTREENGPLEVQKNEEKVSCRNASCVPERHRR